MSEMQESLNPENMLGDGPDVTVLATDREGKPLWEVFGADFLTRGFIMPSDFFAVDDAFALTALEVLRTTSAKELAFLMEHAEDEAKRSAEKQRHGYNVVDGVAYVPLMGVMTKRPTCMSMLFGGGASTLIAMEALRAAAMDAGVRRTALIIESPGGDVNGAFDLANYIAKLQSAKPIDAYIADTGASAAYLAASQARRIFVNDNAVVGSIGVYTKIIDSSKQAEERGLRVHVVKAGKYKAIGEPGVPVTQDEIAQVQKRVNSLQSLFVRAVARGRNMSAEALTKVTDGSTYIGREAVKVLLADGVADMDEFHRAVADGSKLKGVDMASDINDVRAWLQEDSAADNVAEDVPTTQEPVATDPITQPTTNVIAADLVAALASANVTNANDFATIVANAKIGKDYITRLKDQTKQLAVIALGQEAGDEASSIIEVAGVETLRSMGKAYENIAVQKGLLAPPAAPKRKTAPSAVASVTAEDADDNSGPSAEDNRNSLVSTGLYGI